MTSATRTRPPGPTEPAARALGPDLARGFMLLFIALANTHYFLRGPAVLGGYPHAGSAVDAAVTWLLTTFVDGRAFPMFGLLFGYGVAQIARRQRERGARGVRRLLWRRSAALVTVGLTDALLFFVGDILAAYGVLLFLGVWLIRWRDRWLLVLAVAFLALNALPSGDASTISREPADPSMLPPDLSAMLTHRVPVALFIAALGPIGFLAPFAVGLWAGRRRILEQPERHRRALTVAAVAGLGAAVLGAQPIALLLAGIIEAPGQQTLAWLASLHGTTGTLGGLGYAALISLLAVRLAGRRRPIVDAIAATGQRSMTFYLMQSMTWAVVFTPFLLDLSGTLTVLGTAVLAAATWAAGVVIADRMRRAGWRGPFEVLVRRVTYGRREVRAA
ncbi:DUF418 domain-containing protein [Actinoplanes regularis]|uniref:DUF418 domain-containing protein n=1 Tax=Actinoplanes regularis TaxID=52697 RepID=UPI0025527CCC|nr:DUF418 domain-containing protein [Actinoplanes regularis]